MLLRRAGRGLPSNQSSQVRIAGKEQLSGLAADAFRAAAAYRGPEDGRILAASARKLAMQHHTVLPPVDPQCAKASVR